MSALVGVGLRMLVNTGSAVVAVAAVEMEVEVGNWYC